MIFALTYVWDAAFLFGKYRHRKLNSLLNRNGLESWIEPGIIFNLPKMWHTHFASPANRRAIADIHIMRLSVAPGAWSRPIQGAREFSVRTNEWMNVWKAGMHYCEPGYDPSTIIFRLSAKTKTNPAARPCQDLAAAVECRVVIFLFVWFKRRRRVPRNKIFASNQFTFVRHFSPCTPYNDRRGQIGQILKISVHFYRQ